MTVGAGVTAGVGVGVGSRLTGINGPLKNADMKGARTVVPYEPLVVRFIEGIVMVPLDNGAMK